MTLYTQQQIRIADRLYKCRDTAKSLLGERYADYVKKWIELVRDVAAAHNLQTMEVVPFIQRREAQAGKALTEVQILWLAAATVEILEPSV